VNANHARPLAAFWLLAIAAAVITGTGLRANQSPSAVASTAPVSTSRAPEVVLGGVLQARTSQALLHPLAPDLWASGGSASAETGGTEVASPRAPGSTYKARTGGGDAQQVTKTQPRPSGTSTADATATTATTTSAHGKGHGKEDHGGGPTTTITAAPTPSGPANGPGQGSSTGHGH